MSTAWPPGSTATREKASTPSASASKSIPTTDRSIIGSTPPTLDLFAADPLPNNPDETGEETTAAPEATPEEQKPQPAPAQKTTPQRQKAPARKNPANRRPMIGW